MALDTITRREKLLAKICWPGINTQRTRFLSTEAGFCDVPDYGDVKAVYYADDEPVPSRQLAIERVKIGKWIANGKRRSVVARWGYSPRLDTVVIRDVTVQPAG